MVWMKLINPEDTYPIRHQILRPNQPIEACKYEADHQENTFHLGAFLDGKLISIASFYEEKSPNFDAKLQYRLRGMATLEAYRKRKAGSMLISAAEAILKERNVSLWWCNARTSVSDYYKKLGLREHGDMFVIEPLGPHKLMVKELR